MKIAINGFGRIGRSVFRIAFERGIQIAAINDLHGAEDAMYLLKYDSVYGNFKGKVEAKGDELIVNGKKIKILSEMNPEKLPWRKLGVDIVVESTGAFRKIEDAKKHLNAGAKKVLVSAPGKGEMLTIVPGVNEKWIKKSDNVISVASCTTNCLAPVAKVLNDNFKIKKAMMTTVHAYTSSQNLVDGNLDKKRRGRAAAINIVPTTSGATDAVCLTIPELKGKLTGLALRVPVASGSIVDLVVELEKNTSVEEINKAFKKAAEKEMKGIIEYNDDEIVSSDIIGNSHSAIFDAPLTQKIGSNLYKVLAWYDNEYGYSSRMVDVIEMMKKFL